MKKWKCEACGYIHDGDEASVQCPKCGVPGEKAAQLEEMAAKLVERSRHTNALHARLIDLARQAEMVCSDGIKDDLDPGCADVFTKCRAMAWQMMKLALTEQQLHMKKGKWG
jgi:rubredoxin